MADPTPIVDVSKLFSLAGKTAIVTGGTGGLGAAMTVALASGGADIVSIELPDDPSSKTIKEAVEKAGRAIRQYPCNVRDSKSLREVYQQLWSDGIKGDILLNCAGVQRVSMPVEAWEMSLTSLILSAGRGGRFHGRGYRLCHRHQLESYHGLLSRIRKATAQRGQYCNPTVIHPEKLTLFFYDRAAPARL